MKSFCKLVVALHFYEAFKFETKSFYDLTSSLRFSEALNFQRKSINVLMNLQRLQEVCKPKTNETWTFGRIMVVFLKASFNQVSMWNREMKYVFKD